MTNVERTGKRSLAMSRWHRKRFPDDHAASDRDLVGRCPEVACRAPLYVIEDVTTNLDLRKAAAQKNTWWSEQDAYRLGVPVVLAVIHEANEDVLELQAWRCVLAPRRHTECSRRSLIGDGDNLVAYLTRVRRAHAAVIHDDPRPS
jgi:hypothetical protein